MQNCVCTPRTYPSPLTTRKRTPPHFPTPQQWGRDITSVEVACYQPTLNPFSPVFGWLITDGHRLAMHAIFALPV
jgi:hypothetical protein